MKKKILKKTLALFLSSVLALGMVACSGSNDQTTSATDDSEAKSTTASSGTQGNEPVEVVFWHSTSGATGEALESVIKTYNETRGAEKNIKVNLVFQGYEGTDKVILAYQTKDTENAPDINQGLTSTIPSMMDLDWTVSADSYLNDSNSDINKDSFYEAMQRSCYYEGEMVAVPFANSTLLLYYNVDALKEAGLDGPPTTMDELIDYVDKLTIRDASGQATRYGLNVQVKRYQLVNFIVSQSENSFFGDNEGGRSAPMTKLTIGEDGTLHNFLEKWDTLLNTGGYKYVEDSINEEFAQGLSAMVIMSSSRIGTINSLIDDSFSYMTAPIPKVNAGDTSGAAVGGSCLLMFDRGNSARVDAAWDVLQYCSSPEAQIIISKASGYMPVNVEAENTQEMQDFYQEFPQYKVALDSVKKASPLAQEPLDVVYNEINGIITKVMLDFCERNLTIDGAIDKLVSECNAAMDEYYEANN